jgi:preprotein translocase subunit SecE
MKVVNYIVDSFNEVSKNVTWPTVKELQSSTTLVLVASTLFAVSVGVMDLVFEKLLAFVY